jgi:hypothetical protein
LTCLSGEPPPAVRLVSSLFEGDGGSNQWGSLSSAGLSGPVCLERPCNFDLIRLIAGVILARTDSLLTPSLQPLMRGS